MSYVQRRTAVERLFFAVEFAQRGSARPDAGEALLAEAEAALIALKEDFPNENPEAEWAAVYESDDDDRDHNYQYNY